MSGNPNERARRRGLTLVEVVISTGIASIVMLGLGSVVMIATNAIPEPDGATSQLIELNGVVDRITNELRTAERVISWTDHEIAFVVPDRDSDGIGERIRYAWSGDPGDPLLRTLNDRPAGTLVESVQSFALAYEQTLAATSYPAVIAVKPPEEELVTQDIGADIPWAGEIDATTARGQYVLPPLKGDATGWRPTRAQVQITEWDSRSEYPVLIELRDAIGFLPGSTVLASESIGYRDAPRSWGWHEVSFTNAPILSPTSAISILATSDAPTDGGSMFVGWKTDPRLSGYLKSNDGGKTWTYAADASLVFKLWGQVFTGSVTEIIHRRVLDAVRIRIVGTSGAPVDTTVTTINMPELRVATWSYDTVDPDPLTADANFDGIKDWQLRSGGTYSKLSFSNLDSQPPLAINSPTIIEWSAQAPGSDSEVTVSVAAEHTGSLAGLITVFHQRKSTLQYVSLYLGYGSKTLIVASPGIPADQTIAVRLVIDPDRDAASLCVNGVELGTFTYPVEAVPDIPPGISLSTQGSAIITGFTADVLEMVP